MIITMIINTRMSIRMITRIARIMYIIRTKVPAIRTISFNPHIQQKTHMTVYHSNSSNLLYTKQAAAAVVKRRQRSYNIQIYARILRNSSTT